MAEHNEPQTSTDRMHAEVSRIFAEVSRMNAEISRMNAEQNKLHAESLKITCETFWHPVAIATGFYAAVGTVIVVAQKLLS
ncbi:hypothetical protein [Pseudomonas sp. FP2254]|uniref:hypothetical protein n=1 Tax=Pseudomonas sp. FP2254 TaxID=2954087 RepID=UPI0027343BEB|nr:hypothetical protein [Pseudomonas sp. FP2254]WLH39952.1 hypothetical protein PSH94_20510 [Pseudomonas sp. FP2254]